MTSSNSPIIKKKVVVFPAGTEIGLEIGRQLRLSKHFDLIGVNSVADHSELVYPKLLQPFPFVSAPNFEVKFDELMRDLQPDFVIPSHDDAILFFSKLASRYEGTRFLCPSPEIAEVLRSKAKTYTHLSSLLPVPQLYSADSPPPELNAPLFLKPDVGQGSRGARKVHSFDEALRQAQAEPGLLIGEYLPGEEFTVDCFTNRHGKLLYSNARNRLRILNGIAVRTAPVAIEGIDEIAQKISTALKLRGAWFFQVKRRESGELVLLEVASRIAGSMGLSHRLGVNFVELALFDRLDIDVSVVPNHYKIVMDRALSARFSIELDFENVYIDFDDTVIFEGKTVPETAAFLYRMLNAGKRLILLTRHKEDLDATLARHRLTSLFDEIIHLKNGESKAAFITRPNSIFVDDSFSERQQVATSLGIPVFSPNMLDIFGG